MRTGASLKSIGSPRRDPAPQGNSFQGRRSFWTPLGGSPIRTLGVTVLASVGILAAVGVFFFGELALMVAVVFVGLSVLELASELGTPDRTDASRANPADDRTEQR